MSDSTKYTVYEFIEYTKQHPLDWINYCEIVVLPNGMIVLAKPSHQEAVIQYAMKKENKTKSQLMGFLMGDILSPIQFFVDKYSLLAIWYNQILTGSNGVNRFQQHTINELKRSGLLSESIFTYDTKEYKNYLERRKLKTRQVIYYDIFNSNYTLNKDITAPPERYIEVHRGDESSIYKETWIVKSKLGDGELLDVVYTEDSIIHHKVDLIRTQTSENNNCCLKHLIKYIIPAAKFDEYIERFGLEE